MNFTALDSRFQTTCCNRAGSPVTGPASESNILMIRTPLASAAGMDRRQRRVDDLGEAHLLDVEAEGSRDDPREVEQVLDELGLDLGIPVDRVEALLDVLVVELAGTEQSRPADDGVERGPQLVREGREELVLHPAGHLGLGAGVLALLYRRGVVHGQAGAARQLLGDPTVRLLVVAAGSVDIAER